MSDSVTQSDVSDEGQAEQGSTDSRADQGDSKAVQYETYRRTVGEAKKAKEKARELEAELLRYQAQEKQREDQSLEEEKNYRQMIENRDKQIAELSEKYGGLQSEISKAVKRDAFLAALQAQVPRQYHALIPLEHIAVDPSTLEVDEMTVASAVEEFRKTYPHVIESPDSQPKLPTKKPTGSAAGVTSDKTDFASLPQAERGRLLAEELIASTQK